MPVTLWTPKKSNWHLRAVFLTMVLFGLFTTGTQAARLDKFGAHNKNAAATVDHKSWDSLLASFIRTDISGLNRLRYGAFKRKGRHALKAYLNYLQSVRITELNRTEQFAFWVNLYNAKTVEFILDNYPVSSIRKIKSGLFTPGPWKRKALRIEGVALSLDDVEHGILRRFWRDPRVHYAVNCASIGCPNLMKRAYTGARLDAMLIAAAKAYINSPRGVKMSGGSITASKIYSWYVKDFGGDEAGVMRHLRRYAAPALAGRLKAAGRISSYAYDWNLNDAR
jgi:hypothetical protein